MNNELAYWVTFAHLPKIPTRVKNRILARLFEQRKTLVDFFDYSDEMWREEFGLTVDQCSTIRSHIDDLPNNAFLVESLLDQGYTLLPITSSEYSPTLKQHLKYHSPVLLYAKGNIQLLQADTIAIVGSRKAQAISLAFTDNIAKKAAESGKVVVSGFAKGVDRQALDSTLKYQGQSIIVLPQGILTFHWGVKKYYQPIVEGRVLVVSTFHPTAAWSVQLAMARNTIIYGLATEIYVAESSHKGGTWAGVIDGLRRRRTIYVRKPTPDENNANDELIRRGATAVDLEGKIISGELTLEAGNDAAKDAEPGIAEVESGILELLKQGTYSAREIVEKLGITWTPRKVTSYLKRRPEEVIVIRGKPLKFTHISKQDGTLFG